SSGYWYRNFEYQEEQARGLDFTEDLYNSGTLTFDLSKRNRAAIIASTEPKDVTRVEEYKQQEISRRQALTSIYPQANNLIQTLLTAADQFIVARGNQKSVIAGYHWFSDWGRDTMIALPGLTLVTGRAEITRDVLLSFAEFISQGMLPNRFPDAGEEPEYNTVDATLWYFDAVCALIDYTGDYEFVRQNLYEKLIEIIDWHERGTRYGIKVDADGLLHAGESGVQLTWMDAKIGDWVVTPRTGKAVEIQALWYNALCVISHLANEFGDKSNASRFRRMAKRCKHSFNQQFWNEAANCLYDVVDGETRDASMRPNQILTVSLKHSMLNASRAKQVVGSVQRELLTPLGLRSLAVSDSSYRGHYEGGPRERDAVYHQGTVWAWLIGPFITAYIKTNRGNDRSRRLAAKWLEAFEQHLNEAGLGHVSEIFDGDAPHNSRGCIAQAWSVAELLRVAVEDVLRLIPQNKAMAVELPSAASSSASASNNQTLRRSPGGR
ncbi:MAG TPA: amylo-alpha-1,6-glucosidase, partial [Blastocatellia bacterium]|nr:amylo-alpha-1,6-glucosidase [Blastocatellia bacterium]